MKKELELKEKRLKHKTKGIKQTEETTSMWQTYISQFNEEQVIPKHAWPVNQWLFEF